MPRFDASLAIAAQRWRLQFTCTVLGAQAAADPFRHSNSSCMAQCVCASVPARATLASRVSILHVGATPDWTTGRDSAGAWGGGEFETKNDVGAARALGGVTHHTASVLVTTASCGFPAGSRECKCVPFSSIACVCALEFCAVRTCFDWLHCLKLEVPWLRHYLPVV